MNAQDKREEPTGAKPSNRGKMQQEISRSPEELEPSPAPGAWVWEEPAGRASVVTEPSASPGSPSTRRKSFDRPGQPHGKLEDSENLIAQVESLSERFLRLEEAKQVSEKQMAEKLQQVITTCKAQGDLITAQKRRLEDQERQIHEQDERMIQLEEDLANMDQLLQEQQLQIQQQDQRLDQDDQQLKEQQQQLEQQDQEIEKHGVLLTDFLVSHAASSDSLSARQPRTHARAEDGAQGTPMGGKRRPCDMLSVDSSVAGAVGSGGALAGSSSERPHAVVRDGNGQASIHQALDETATKPLTKPSGQLWESALELCADRRYLEAYKQVIAEPEESCLLRLMQHTGPIVDKLDAESNSRLIRRLIHILSSPSKEPASASIEQIFAWLWQALNQGIHFTASQVEDLVSALHRVSGGQSALTSAQKAEAAEILQQVSALRRS